MRALGIHCSATIKTFHCCEKLLTKIQINLQMQDARQFDANWRIYQMGQVRSLYCLFLNSKHPKWMGLTFPMILAVPGRDLSMDPTTYISETSSYPPPEVPDPDIYGRAATNEAAAAWELCAVVLIGITHEQRETGRNFMELSIQMGQFGYRSGEETWNAFCPTCLVISL